VAGKYQIQELLKLIQATDSHLLKNPIADGKRNSANESLFTAVAHIFILFFQKQKHLPKILICNHASAYLVLPSVYFVK
jgi:hypothetical protein